MATWLVECYAPGMRAADVADEGDHIRAAVEVVRLRDWPIDYLGALLVADDEAAFHAFAADDRATVADVCRRASLRYTRIVESVTVVAPGLADALARLLATPHAAAVDDG